jgi:hypothetical protein
VASGGVVDGLRGVAALFGWYGVPAIFSWSRRPRLGWRAREAGSAPGLLSAAGTRLLGLTLGPLVLREAVVYALLGALGGTLGFVAGRSLLSEQEALFDASRGS